MGAVGVSDVRCTSWIIPYRKAIDFVEHTDWIASLQCCCLLAPIAVHATTCTAIYTAHRARTVDRFAAAQWCSIRGKGLSLPKDASCNACTGACGRADTSRTCPAAPPSRHTCMFHARAGSNDTTRSGRVERRAAAPPIPRTPHALRASRRRTSCLIRPHPALRPPSRRDAHSTSSLAP